jgi:hypothetical protein
MLKIRNATPEDRNQIEMLTRLLVSERKETFDEKRFEWGLLRRLFDPLQRQGTFVAEIDEITGKTEELIGMIFSELRVDPFGNSEGHIKEIYLRPKHRTDENLEALLNAVIDKLKNMDFQVIKVTLKPEDEQSSKIYSMLNLKEKYSVLELRLD